MAARRKTTTTTKKEPEPAVEELGTAEAAPVVEKKTAEEKQAEKKQLFEDRLSAFKEFSPTLRTGFGPDNNLQAVGNVPGDMVTTWATDPRIDKGQCISLYRSLGFSPVYPEEVTMNDADDTKLVVRNYEVWNGLVCRGGGTLMIGYRQYRDERKAYDRLESKKRIDTPTSPTENMERTDNSTFAGLR